MDGDGPVGSRQRFVVPGHRAVVAVQRVGAPVASFGEVDGVGDRRHVELGLVGARCPGDLDVREGPVGAGAVAGVPGVVGELGPRGPRGDLLMGEWGPVAHRRPGGRLEGGTPGTDGGDGQRAGSEDVASAVAGHHRRWLVGSRGPPGRWSVVVRAWRSCSRLGGPHPGTGCLRRGSSPSVADEGTTGDRRPPRAVSPRRAVASEGRRRTGERHYWTGIALGDSATAVSPTGTVSQVPAGQRRYLPGQTNGLPCAERW